MKSKWVLLIILAFLFLHNQISIVKAQNSTSANTYHIDQAKIQIWQDGSHAYYPGSPYDFGVAVTEVTDRVRSVRTFSIPDIILKVLMSIKLNWFM